MQKRNSPKGPHHGKGWVNIPLYLPDVVFSLTQKGLDASQAGLLATKLMDKSAPHRAALRALTKHCSQIELRELAAKAEAVRRANEASAAKLFVHARATLLKHFFGTVQSTSQNPFCRLILRMLTSEKDNSFEAVCPTIFDRIGQTKNPQLVAQEFSQLKRLVVALEQGNRLWVSEGITAQQRFWKFISTQITE